MTASERFRRGLVAELRALEVLSSSRVEGAFLGVARERFLPEVLADGGLQAVYRDKAIAIKRDPRGFPLSSSSQPAIMAEMLELLDVQPGDRVLEVGAGTGYNAALLGQLVGPSGQVTSIDVDAELARRARRALRDAGVRATIVAGDGREGYASRAPYDRIIVTAAADAIPAAWLDQLTEGGRLVLPLGLDPEQANQLIPALERHQDQLRSVGVTWGAFMPLHDGDGGWQPPPSTLSAVHSANGQHTSLASLTGPGVKRLSSSAARRLLSLRLADTGTPHRRGVAKLTYKRPPLLLIYLLLNLPTKRRLWSSQRGRWEVGLVDRRGQSAAIVSLRSPGNDSDEKPPPRVRWRLDAYGGDSAATELDQLIRQWQALQRAGQIKLRIAARGPADPLRLRFAWADSYN